MGFFGKQSDQSAAPDEAPDIDEVIDAQYRAELRQAGIDHFKKLIDQSAGDLKADIDASTSEVAAELKSYMQTQLDANLVTINKQISSELEARLEEFNRQNSEIQSRATDSLNQSTSAVYEKYQKFNSTLQQSITSQEVMMISMFQDNKARMSAAQSRQDQALAELQQTTADSKQKSNELHQALSQNAEQQAQQLDEVYQQNLERVEATAQAQEKLLQNLSASTEALEQKYQQLSQLVDQSVENQKTMLTAAINDNMARIIEHYLVEALGEQSDLRTQLPSILEQMEQNKQAMVEDMKLWAKQLAKLQLNMFCHLV